MTARIMLALALLTLAACSSAHAVPAGETYVGPLRELWDDGRPDRDEAEAVAVLLAEGDGATLALDGCTVPLVLVSGEEPRRRYVLDGERVPCEAGEVDQVLAGDPVRREPPPPGEALDVELWITRADGAPSLVVFRGVRVER